MLNNCLLRMSRSKQGNQKEAETAGARVVGVQEENTNMNCKKFETFYPKVMGW